MKDVFPLVFTEQRLHGVRFADFRRYRAHCASRIRKLRRSLGLQQGKSRRYKAVPLPQLPKDVRVLEIHILEAERCWASAQEALAGVATREGPVGQLQHRAQRRLARAVRHATALVQAVHHVSFPCSFTEAQSAGYLQSLKAEWFVLRKDAAGAKQALNVAMRVVRNFRTREPLDSAYVHRIEALEAMRRSMSLEKPEISAEEISELDQVIKSEVAVVTSFLKRPLKFKGGFEACERLEKLVDMVGNVALLDRLSDIKRLLAARSYAQAGRFVDAYSLVRRVGLHAEVDEAFFPEFPTALQRCRLSIGAELLKTIQTLLPESAVPAGPVGGREPMEVAEGLEEEKGEDAAVASPKKQGVTGLVGKVTSFWFGGSRK